MTEKEKKQKQEQNKRMRLFGGVALWNKSMNISDLEYLHEYHGMRFNINDGFIV